MNRQILPAYTNMETMTADIHDVTTEQLKNITFQVIPQFYWKYTWSYNEYMIHPVGRLKSPSDELPMYDMLGNVWEWVRDDWTEKISTAFAGKVNPISGSTSAATSPKPKKTIRGGAFDQLVRKVISPTREGLTWDQFKSEFGIQANVGFRPAMVYTEETLVSGKRTTEEGSDYSSTPFDLFFLFDASSTQDNQITEMVEAARKIVKMFAPTAETAPTGTPNYTTNEGCFVGSALFLGPQIRLMCSNQIGTDTIKQFVTTPRVTDYGAAKKYADYVSWEDRQNKEDAYNAARARWEENESNGWVLDSTFSGPYWGELYDDKTDFFRNVARHPPLFDKMIARFT